MALEKILNRAAKYIESASGRGTRIAELALKNSPVETKELAINLLTGKYLEEAIGKLNFQSGVGNKAERMTSIFERINVPEGMFGDDIARIGEMVNIGLQGRNIQTSLLKTNLEIELSRIEQQIAQGDIGTIMKNKTREELIEILEAQAGCSKKYKIAHAGTPLACLVPKTKMGGL